MPAEDAGEYGKCRAPIALSLLVCAGVFCAAASLAAAEPVEWSEARPEDTGAVLINPDMGWVLYQYSNVITNYGARLEPSDDLSDWPGISVVYLRLPWSFVEPAEGAFNWSIVDTPAQRWIERGKQIALRLSCSESWLRYGTPQWVQEAGAQGHEFNDDGKGAVANGAFWEPNFDDPVFLAKLGRFLEAVARRYDGDPRVAFIDVGSFGIWGEGHTAVGTHLKYAPEVIQRHIDLHLKHFKKTPLAANDDYAIQGREAVDYAARAGLWLRDDSILVSCKRAYRSAELATLFWPRSPVILEHEHYGGSVHRGCWGDGSKLVAAVEDYHASFMSIHWWPREFLREQADNVARINRRLGYRIQLRRIRWPRRVVSDSRFEVQAEWANAGVAPCYPGGYAALTLKDARGGIVVCSVDEALDVRGLEVGPAEKIPVRTVRHTFGVPANAPPGDYTLFISVGTRIGTPVLELALPGHDGHRRYRLGDIRVAVPGATATQSSPGG